MNEHKQAEQDLIELTKKNMQKTKVWDEIKVLLQ
jgi:hypothetical protein